MKKVFLGIYILLALVVCLWTAKCVAVLAAEQQLSRGSVQSAPTAAPETIPETVIPETAAPETTLPDTTVPVTAPTTLPTEAPTEPPPETTEQTEVAYVLTFTEEEEELLLKLGMAERGTTGCTECIALVMRTVLNRVESPKFSSTIRGVIYAQDQFTPAMDGTLEEAVPGWRCQAALEMIKQGWDESQGALYYEWCEGESWHSQNLNLLLQHCDTRFYN